MPKKLSKAERGRRQRQVAERARTAKAAAPKVKADAASSAAAPSRASEASKGSSEVGKTATKTATKSPEKPAKAARLRSSRVSSGDKTSRIGLGGEIAERIAWSMLAALTALAGVGFLLALAGALVPSLCPPGGDATCSLGWMLLIGMVGYPLALLATIAIGGLGIWFWVAFLIGYAPLVIFPQIGEWWWWAAVALMPAVGAVASWGVGRPAISRVHRWILIGLAVVAAGAVGWWYAFAR